MEKRDGEITTASDKLQSEEEFVYRFKLENDAEISAKPFCELFRTTIRELMKYVTFTNNSEEVKVTGFAFRDNPELVYSIFSEQKND